MNSYPIQTYVSNLVRRQERKSSTIREFAGKTEYSLHIVPAIEHSFGPFGLWQTFIRILKKEKAKGTPYFLFCEDDHTFSSNYTYNYLEQCLLKADSFNADLLSGGMSWIESPIQCSEHLFWGKRFNGTQFIIIYNRFYDRILKAADGEDYFILDMKLSELSDSLFVMFPFISAQKDFGYSDVTPQNNKKGYVTGLFTQTELKLSMLNQVKQSYGLL